MVPVLEATQSMVLSWLKDKDVMTAGWVPEISKMIFDHTSAELKQLFLCVCVKDPNHGAFLGCCGKSGPRSIENQLCDCSCMSRYRVVIFFGDEVNVNLSYFFSEASNYKI